MPRRAARSLTRSVAAVAAASLLVALAACGGDGDGTSTARPEAVSRTLSFTPCGKVACTGEIDGAAYEIRLPTTWNGTLLLYSHGYRAAEPSPPDYRAPETDAVVASTDDTATALLAAGYALAGSAYAKNGWAVRDGVSAGEKLHDFFVRKVGRPDRVYVWGDSLGGLITQTLAEEHPDWVSGAVPLCGVLGGATLNFDVGLDVSFAVKTLLYPDMKVTGYASYAEAKATYEEAQRRILAATRDITGGIPKLLLISALVDGPRQTGRFDGSSVTSGVSAIVETVLTGLAFSTTGRYELEQRVGGNPSTNGGADYGARVSPAETATIDAVSAGSVARNVAALAAAPRVRADADARTAADRLGNPTGRLKDPTITLHTAADPLVLVQNESVFGERVNAARGRTADLVQAFTVAPSRYSAPAPYGAGHCNFTTASRTGVITALDRWVRTGQIPSADDLGKAIGPDSGYDPTYRPGPWPAATTD